MARRIAGVGFVTVSLRRSMMFIFFCRSDFVCFDLKEEGSITIRARYDIILIIVSAPGQENGGQENKELPACSLFSCPPFSCPPFFCPVGLGIQQSSQVIHIGAKSADQPSSLCAPGCSRR